MQSIDDQLATRLPLQILVVEDNLINQQVTTQMLGRMGYSPAVANDGLEALAAVQRGAFELVFMDLQMPKLDGLEATRQIRQREAERPDWAERPTLIIVALTTHTTPADRQRCTEAGMDDFLAKPIHINLLQGMIEKWGAVIHNAPPPAPQAVEWPAPAAAEEAVVAMDRLHEFSGGDADAFRELVDFYLQQTGEQLALIEAAIQAGDSRELERLAHSCAGASATCGMNAVVPALRELERLGHEGRWDGVKELYAETVTQFGRIREFLAVYQTPQN